VSVAAAVLAAGRGTRFDSDTPKALAVLRGRPLVAWALDAMLQSGLSPRLLVVAPGVEVAASVHHDVEVVEARDAELGIAHSLRAVLDTLESRDEVSAVCIGLADQPRVGPGSYRRLADEHARGTALAVATYGGQRGNPVLLARSLWPEARTLEGDEGARALMMDHDLVEVDCTDTGSARDVDTLDDLRAVEHAMDDEETGRP
jgi:molybdenum cofactor cytidylyltransferase